MFEKIGVYRGVTVNNESQMVNTFQGSIRRARKDKCFARTHFPGKLVVKGAGRRRTSGR